MTCTWVTEISTQACTFAQQTLGHGAISPAHTPTFSQSNRYSPSTEFPIYWHSECQRGLGQCTLEGTQSWEPGFPQRNRHYTAAELDSAFPDVWSYFWNEEVNYSLCLWSSSLVSYLTTGSSCSGGLGKAQPSPLGLESFLAQSALPGHGVSPPSVYFQGILTS